MSIPLLVAVMLKFRAIRADDGWTIEGYFGKQGAVILSSLRWRTKALAQRRARRMNATWLKKRMDKVLS